MNYLITYDLNKPGQDYKDLYESLKKYRYVHPMESVWFIKSNDSSTTIYNALKPCIDQNDSLFISEITSNRNGWISKDAWDFLNKV